MCICYICTLSKDFIGVPVIIPEATINDNTIIVNGNNVTLTLSWGEPCNNFDPIVNYTVSCSGDVSCPVSFTTADNTTRSYTITNLTTMTTTNSIGSGEAGVVVMSTPSGVNLTTSISSVVITTTVPSDIPTSTKLSVRSTTTSTMSMTNTTSKSIHMSITINNKL